jgi:ABC-type Mn2+/Zn2+ transport system permease subunit
MVLLAVAIVVTMQLAGVILATAMLVLPGAAALQLTRRLVPAFVLTMGMSLVGVVAGLILSFETDWQSGPNIALVYVAMFALARAVSVLRR